MSHLKPRYQSILAGVLLALAFPAYHLFPLAWVALIPLFLLSRRLGPRACLAQWFAAGLAFHLVLLQWLLSNFQWAGGWAFWGFLGLSIVMACYWAVFGAAWAWLRTRRTPLPGWIVAAVLWMAMEHLQTKLLTGFGWGSLAYSQGKDLPLLQWAAVGGGPLISGMLVGANALGAEAVASCRGRVWRVAVLGAVIAASHGVGWLMLAPPEPADTPLRVGLFQPRFPQEMKWDPEYTVEMVRSAHEKSRNLAAIERARGRPIDLILWPESLIMVAPDLSAANSNRRPVTVSQEIGKEIVDLLNETGAALFAGTVRHDEQTGGTRNSSMLVQLTDQPADPSGRGSYRKAEVLDYYDKIHLAPFGEYVPMRNVLPFISKIVPSIGDIESGTETRVLALGDHTFGPMICFEVLFASIAERLRENDVDMLVVITNLAWFGASNAIPEELEIARVRAVETRLPLLHCANTGISGMFDPWGRFRPVDRWPDGTELAVPPAPHATIGRRLVGAFDVPRPGGFRVPHGPVLIPWAALALALAFVVWGKLAGKRAPGPEGP